VAYRSVASAVRTEDPKAEAADQCLAGATLNVRAALISDSVVER